ncbi:GNAT family N-acetyltransferase [Nonomuraea sp. NPDC001023]|uniref:GNAT family N-acetyltransferase n=1 Tax=unclassified Nonomuraea TaxID=2593643 RepID=UPI003327FF23
MAVARRAVRLHHAVGVRRDAQGQGLARTLLAHVLRGLRADGLDHAVLDVDAESPTGTVGLYRSLGFTVTFSASL